jgi:hypothetical protein
MTLVYRGLARRGILQPVGGKTRYMEHLAVYSLY